MNDKKVNCSSNIAHSSFENSDISQQLEYTTAKLFLGFY